jgi:nitroreductase
MIENNKYSKAFEQIIRTRRTIRSFTDEAPNREDINEIVASALYAPYAGVTGIPIHEIRKVFILPYNSDAMKGARELLISQIKSNYEKINKMLIFFPFLKKKMKPFAERLKSISRNGIPSLNAATYYIIIAEKKGFPPVGKQSIAHALQNMWLTATNKGLGFHLLSATGSMSKNRQFLKLLGLPKGDFEIDGCVIGNPAQHSDIVKEIDLSKCVKWIE